MSEKLTNKLNCSTTDLQSGDTSRLEHYPGFGERHRTVRVQRQQLGIVRRR